MSDLFEEAMADSASRESVRAQGPTEREIRAHAWFAAVWSNPLADAEEIDQQVEAAVDRWRSRG